MTRLLTATIFLITLGLAFAQPPTDYTLLCEVEGEIQASVVGAASYVDGELHVALDESLDADWTCDGTLTVEQDPTLEVVIEFDAETGEATVTVVTEDETDTDLSGDAQTLPEEAIAGMVIAQENRAMAAEHRADAEAKADAARERGEEEAAEEREPEEGEPEEPEVAVENATEVGGGVGIDAKPDEAGEGRP